MSFLYPLFLFAGATLAIPVLIHLFNLRRYKTILFPHTRFLKNIQLNSRKQSQVRYKWLLAARLIFLACLVLAFAQPFFRKDNKTNTANRLQVIYLDNSYSMSARKGARSLLDVARDAAARQVKHAPPGARFLLLTNDRPASYHSEPADKALTEIYGVDFSATPKTAGQVLAMAQSMAQESGGDADLYYYSDFQTNAFPGLPEKALMQHVTFYGLPVQAADLSDVYIDTAFLTTPVLETGKSNNLVVRTHCEGTPPKENPVLSLSVNGQVKSAATIDFSRSGHESVDTLNFEVNDANWQQLELTVNDAGGMRFDDTFRITARSSPNLSVLVLNEGQPNPYIQAAFRAYDGFRLNQLTAGGAAGSWKDYNLVILNGITRMDDALGRAMNDALTSGQTVCIFPGRTTDFAALNEGLKQAGNIAITGIDTAVQTAASLQQGSRLVRDLFERIPDNVQLPVANWHYIISAGLDANQQSVLSFRNGDPLLAGYSPQKGRLYICATSADLQSGNFPGSYFFTPFLYEMAAESGSSNIYAISPGMQQAVYLPLAGAAGRAAFHVYGLRLDVIPPQRPSGAGVDVFVDQAVQQPGFYALAAQGSDTTRVALNQDKAESRLTFRDIGTLKNEWKGDNIKWMSITDAGSITDNSEPMPLWKICVIVAALMLGVETFLLARVRTAAVQAA